MDQQRVPSGGGLVVWQKASQKISVRRQIYTPAIKTRQSRGQANQTGEKYNTTLSLSKRIGCLLIVRQKGLLQVGLKLNPTAQPKCYRPIKKMLFGITERLEKKERKSFGK